MFFKRSFGVSAVKTAEGEYEFALSSEQPVERWFGIEILDHSPEAVNLERLADGRHPLLVNHNIDNQVGVLSRAWLDQVDRKIRVSSRFSRAPKAQEIKQDVEDNIRTLVSVGYMIDQVKEEKRNADGSLAVRILPGDVFEREMRQKHGEHFERVLTVSDREPDKIPVYRIIRWTPFEASIVSVPADITVGKGRSVAPVTVTQEVITESLTMVRTIADQSPALSAATREEAMPEVSPAAPVAPAVSPAAPVVTPNATVIEAQRAEVVREMEKNRVRGIENLCKLNQLDDKYKDYWIRSGMSLDQVSDDMLRIMEERGRNNPQSVSRLGLSDRETREFSLCRAINACSTNDWNLAPFELECSRAIAKAANRMPDPKKFFIPYEVQARQHETSIERLAALLMKRDLTVATAGAGGYLVGAQNVSFIELLRNKSVVFNMGAVRLSGLRDNVTIPKHSATGSTTWLANEAAQLSEVNQTFVQVSLTPKTVGGYTEISRQLLLQSNPSIEGIVSADLATIVALDIDLKALNGSGASGQPTGILNTAGIGSVTGTSLDYADIVEFQTDVFAGNALSGNAGYVTTGAVAGLLKGRVKFTSTASPIWEGRLEEGLVDGYRAMASNQMPSATMIFGDFAQLIVAEWGVLEVEANPYADFKAGIVGVRAIASIDIGVRYPTAFSAASSIT